MTAFRLCRIADHAIGNAVERPNVAIDEDAECRRVPRTNPRHQRIVAVGVFFVSRYRLRLCHVPPPVMKAEPVDDITQRRAIPFARKLKAPLRLAEEALEAMSRQKSGERQKRRHEGQQEQRAI